VRLEFQIQACGGIHERHSYREIAAAQTTNALHRADMAFRLASAFFG
jgi:hypothetical protein